MNLKAGLVLILAGVFVGAQILKGGALDRILSGSSSSTPPASDPTAVPPAWGPGSVFGGSGSPYLGYQNLPPSIISGLQAHKGALQ